jgi:spermidine synthase
MIDSRTFEQRVAPGVRVGYEAERVLHQVKSSAHEKLVMANAHFGRMMMIDGVVQLSAADEFIDREMMSHVPMLAHGAVERVLIVGGGDCGLAEEVLKHSGVRTLVQIEIDPQVVKLSQTYFSHINRPVFRDPRFVLRIGDGAEFVAATDERFDLILVDAADPEGGGLPLFTEAFYRNARGCLAPGGVLIAKIGVPFLQPLHFVSCLTRLSRLFPHVAPYLVPVPHVFGGPVAFAWASSVSSPNGPGLQVLRERYEAAAIDTRYYTPEIHEAAFVLPRFIRTAVDRAIRPDDAIEIERTTPRLRVDMPKSVRTTCYEEVERPI